MLKGVIIEQLPFKGLDKVSDLIYFDGPILSHFTDKFGKDILFYWVDYNENHNRWLVFQISKEQLCSYLLRKQSLKKLIQNPVNDIYFSVEIGHELNYENITQIFKDDLIETYVPKKDAFFSSDLPKVYEKEIKQFENTYAKEIFLESSLFIKASPAKNNNLGLVGILDGADFLYGIGSSFKGLIEHEATNEFVKRGIADSKRINKATTALVKLMQPNLVEVKAASFAIAISPNSFIEVGEQFLNKEWRDNLFKKFKTEIIEIDKKSSEEIEEIIRMYGEEDTANIYKPLLDLYNNKKIIINITDNNFNLKRTIQPVKKEYVQRLTTKKVKHQEEPEDRIAKVKYNKKTGKIAGTSGATLFDQSISTSWKTIEIKTDKKNYKLRHPITADYKYESKLHHILNEELDIFATGDSLSEAETNFYDEFDKLIKHLIDTDNIKLIPRELEIKRYLEFHLRG